jgi:peptidoglycan/LPS O-acetylase OafA/YrhL
MGIMVHRAPRSRASQALFWLYLFVIIAAMIYDWRWRLVSALVVGTLLFAADKTGLSTRWPKNRLVAYLGRTSYSLFLIHFPVLVVISTLWMRLGWHSAPAAVWGLLIAYLVSVAASAGFYQLVEVPAAKLAKQSS